jgi:hypothetical protein
MRTWRKHLSVIAYLLAIPAIMACQAEPVGPTTSGDGGGLPNEQPGIHRDADQARLQKALAGAPRFLAR